MLAHPPVQREVVCRSSNVFLVSDVTGAHGADDASIGNEKVARKNCKVSNKRRATLYAFIFAMNFYLRNKGESLSFPLLEEIEKNESD